MKKSLLSGFLGIAFAFAMVACGNDATEPETTTEETTVEQTEHQCMHQCQGTCADSVCNAAKCENCTCPDSSACHHKHACKGEGNGECCKSKAADADAHQCCKDKANGEGCQKHCEKHQ